MDIKNQINMFINLGFVLLHPTNDDEMTKKKKSLHLKTYIYKKDSNCTKYCPIVIQGEI